MQAHQIAGLQKDLDDLNQYNRRENLCFTNLKLDNDHDAETQVRNLCHEIGVEVTTDDILACHPLQSCKGRGVRVICRLKDRKLAHKIFENRKGTKDIGTNKKSELAARPDKGFAVQPNLTPMRAKLLAQVKDVAKLKNWHGAWVDYRTGVIMVKLRAADRPVQIRTTSDLRKFAGRDYIPNDYYFCVRETSDYLFDECFVGTGSEAFSPTEPSVTAPNS